MAVRALGRSRLVRLAAVLGLVAAVVGVVASSALSNASQSKAKWVIGVSNTLVGNGWREEMICSVKAQATASGNVSKVIVADRNGSAAEQSADIRNLISAGVNAIIIDPADPKALNPVIAQAAARGIKVVSVDQTVTAPQAYNVTNDQTKYGTSVPCGCSSSCTARATSSRCAASPARRPTPTVTTASCRPSRSTRASRS
jgi:ABC-type sugar transport system substrate-binding protein